MYSRVCNDPLELISSMSSRRSGSISSMAITKLLAVSVDNPPSFRLLFQEAQVWFPKGALKCPSEFGKG